MIALTQEKREELKAFLSASIENRCTVYTLTKQRELEALRDQIALASITAEPVAYCDDIGIETLKIGNPIGVRGVSVSPYNTVTLFTAPPVPEIKFPEYKRNGKPLNILAELVWAECIDEIKRLNGLGE